MTTLLYTEEGQYQHVINDELMNSAGITVLELHDFIGVVTDKKQEE